MAAEPNGISQVSFASSHSIKAMMGELTQFQVKDIMYSKIRPLFYTYIPKVQKSLFLCSPSLKAICPHPSLPKIL